MKRILGLLLLISMNASAQKLDFPFNFAIPEITPDVILAKTFQENSLFSGYNSSKRQLLASDTSSLWKSLHIWDFDDKEAIDALFSFNEQGKLKSIRFSSSSLAEIMIEGRAATPEDYFVRYGKPLMNYFQQHGWKLKDRHATFPLTLTRNQQLVTIKIETLIEVAINPETDEFSGFHYNFPEDHLPSKAQYLRFEIAFME